VGTQLAADHQAGRVAEAMTHDELVLSAALARVNKSIARYISRVLDVDQGRTEYTRSLFDVQRELADELAEVEQQLRQAMGSGIESPTLRLIEGGTEPSRPHDCTKP
jgi:hypothetical protein